MPSSPNPIFTQKPFSLAHLRRVFAMSDPVKLAALTALMPWDYFHKTYEFNEATLNPDWTSAATSGTAFAFNAQRNAGLVGATGAPDDAVVELKYHADIFDAADNPFFWLRWIAPSVVTGFSFEIGFCDPKTSELPAVTDVDGDSPTTGNSATDIAVVHMDTDQTIKTARLVGDATSGASVGLTLVNRAGTAWTPTASGIIDVIVGVRANLTYCWIWDSLAPMGIMQSVAQGPDSGVLIHPYALFRDRDAATRSITILKAVVVAEENRTS